MMSSDSQSLSCLFCVPLRTGEAGRPLYNRTEGGHKDRQQGETLRICSNEGTVLIPDLVHACLSMCCPACGHCDWWLQSSWKSTLNQPAGKKKQQKWSLYFCREKPVHVL